ncbi:cytochrome-c peroxidase [Tenacibaculum dicentrarchi]|uniref:cytochrome-c peroxidase n=1 Tax=Tenacibaculum dicentrarchi TaxID=669041 RepID=UPI00351593A4
MKKTLFFFSFLLMLSCKEAEAPYVKIPLVFEKPANFPDLAYNLEANPPTKKGFELGKKLFYEGKLSSDGTISCGFCHLQANAFTHHGHQFSHGIDDQQGVRNTPPIQNAAFLKQFMADGATDNLNRFSILPITNPVEMNETIGGVLDKLKADNEYQKLFEQAFDDGEINMSNMLKALSQFMMMMVSSNSKYDKYVRNEEGGNFTAQEKQGLASFKEKCASCHQTDLFTDDSFRNNGLAEHPILKDLGRAKVTLNEKDNFKFKVPSLRNIALTKPYMHDGRFYTLKRVLDFYSNDVQNTPNLDPILKHSDGRLGIALSEEEKENILVFLNTLTDLEFITDERFSE